MNRFFKYTFFLITVVLFQNCGMEGTESNDTLGSASIDEKANFVWINENIVQPKCVECHNGSFAFAGLNFTTYEGVLEAIVPGQPEVSTFYTRSFTTQFFELDDEEREIIRTWIANGATD